jgi:hypothetical protein
MSNGTFAMHQLRVMDERDDQTGKVERLMQFTGSETMRSLPHAEQWRLVRQLEHQRAYLAVLNERIAAF